LYKSKSPKLSPTFFCLAIWRLVRPFFENNSFHCEQPRSLSQWITFRTPRGTNPLRALLVSGANAISPNRHPRHARGPNRRLLPERPLTIAEAITAGDGCPLLLPRSSIVNLHNHLLAYSRQHRRPLRKSYILPAAPSFALRTAYSFPFEGLPGRASPEAYRPC